MPINPLASYLFRKTPVVAILSTLSTAVFAVDNFAYQSAPTFNPVMIASTEPTQVNSQLASMDNGQALIDTEQNRQVGELSLIHI